MPRCLSSQTCLAVRRDAGAEVGVTSVLTWLTLLSQLHVAGKDLEDETVSIVTGAGLRRAGAAGPQDDAQGGLGCAFGLTLCFHG